MPGEETDNSSKEVLTEMFHFCKTSLYAAALSFPFITHPSEYI